MAGYGADHGLHVTSTTLAFPERVWTATLVPGGRVVFHQRSPQTLAPPASKTRDSRSADEPWVVYVMRSRGRRFAFPSSLLENCFSPRTVRNSSSCCRTRRPLFERLLVHQPATRDVTFHPYQPMVPLIGMVSRTIGSKSPPPPADPQEFTPSERSHVAPSSVH